MCTRLCIDLETYIHNTQLSEVNTYARRSDEFLLITQRTKDLHCQRIGITAFIVHRTVITCSHSFSQDRIASFNLFSQVLCWFWFWFWSTDINSITMSNAFEKIMSQTETDGNMKPSTSGGRPMHEYWSGYKKVQVNGRVAAKCKFCPKTIANTAKSRMLKHR